MFDANDAVVYQGLRGVEDGLKNVEVFNARGDDRRRAFVLISRWLGKIPEDVLECVSEFARLR